MYSDQVGLFSTVYRTSLIQVHTNQSEKDRQLLIGWFLGFVLGLSIKEVGKEGGPVGVIKTRTK